MENGIYRIKNNRGEFSDSIAIQICDGKGRPMHVTDNGSWGFAKEEFSELTERQIESLALYGLHANQTLAWHSKIDKADPDYIGRERAKKSLARQWER